MKNIIIKSEADIAQLQKGDHYIVDGPADPEAFFDFLQEIEPLIEAHITEICKAEVIKEDDNTHEGTTDPKDDKIIQKFIDHYNTNPNNVHSKFLESDLLAIMGCLDMPGDESMSKREEAQLIIQALVKLGLIQERTIRKKQDPEWTSLMHIQAG